MVGQSDLPFRLQTVRNGATSTWTQMYLAPDLNSDQDMLETLCKSLEVGQSAPENVIRDSTHPLAGTSAPQIVQLAGNDVQQLVESARKVAHLADAIDLNLGCPQRHAEQGHYGAYLLPKQNWPLLTELVSGLVQAVDIPITTKIRLTVPKEQTPQLAVTLARAGSSLVTLHPNTNKRRIDPRHPLLSPKLNTLLMKLENLQQYPDTYKTYILETTMLFCLLQHLSNCNILAHGLIGLIAYLSDDKVRRKN